MQVELVCTSININKACRKPEQLGENRCLALFTLLRLILLSKGFVRLDSKTESLQLTVTEVLKRHSKSRKGSNQVGGGLTQGIVTLLLSLHLLSDSTSQCLKSRWTRCR